MDSSTTSSTTTTSGTDLAKIAAEVDEYNRLEELWAMAWDMTGALGIDVVVIDGQLVIEEGSWRKWRSGEDDATQLASFRHYHPNWRPEHMHGLLRDQ